MADRERVELLPGTLELIVLRALATMGPLHAYGQASRLEQVAEHSLTLNQGTLYPALVRLEQRGWLKGTWRQTESRREAKSYAITPGWASRRRRSGGPLAPLWANNVDKLLVDRLVFRKQPVRPALDTPSWSAHSISRARSCFQPPEQRKRQSCARYRMATRASGRAERRRPSLRSLDNCGVRARHLATCRTIP